MRAYLRLDPHLADKKRGYPDGAFRAFVECLTFAEQQPERGYFRNEKLLRVFLDKRARWVPYLIGHDDLLRQPDGRLYLDGWKEWQEGDVTVPERMARLRARKARGVTPDDTAPVTPGVTVPVTTPRIAEAVSGKPLAVGEAEAEAATRNNGLPQTFMGYAPRKSYDPEGGAGLWNGKGAHDGRHGQGCGVCFPLIHSEEEVMP